MNVKTALVWFALPLATAGCTTMEAQIKSKARWAGRTPITPEPPTNWSSWTTRPARGRSQGQRPARQHSGGHADHPGHRLHAGAAIGLVRAGITPPASLPQGEVAEINKLKSPERPGVRSGIRRRRVGHPQRAVAVLQKEDAATQDGALRTQVEMQLPTVQTNLSTLQGLADEYSGKTQG